MTDNRDIDVYDVNTGKLVEQISQWEALRRLLVHCCEVPTVKQMENQRWRVDDLLKGGTARYANRLYCCTQPEPGRVPEPPMMGTAGGCPACMGTGIVEVVLDSGWGGTVCVACGGTGNSD